MLLLSLAFISQVDDLLSLDQGHAACIGKMRSDTKFRSKNLKRRAYLGYGRIILNISKGMGCEVENWIQDRNQRRAFVYMVLNLRIL
jgi:hypothetical protein